jgi:catechol 1,2-dioxygenase
MSTLPLGPVSPKVDFDETTATDLVNARWAATPDRRLKAVLESMVEHLHDFVRDVEPTEDEWIAAIEFLTATGQQSDDVRQEFILLSDILGVSMLIDAINNRKPEGATESTVLGPFHLVNSPARELGSNISLDHVGMPCVVAGRVRGVDGERLPMALVDVWQANGDGFYDVQQPGVQPERNLRGLFTTDTEGRYWFRTVLPRHYAVPDDGPVGSLLRATGRHAYRPAHIHFIATKAGYEPVTTHVFLQDSPYLDSDAVFGVKSSLIRPARLVKHAEQMAEFGASEPFYLIEFDVTLTR